MFHSLGRRTALLAGSFALAVAAGAADKGEIGSRGIIREGISPSGVVRGDLKKLTQWESATAFRYKLLLLDKNGKTKPVPENYAFKVGQQFRLEIESDADLYFYVFHEGPDTVRTVLLPDKYDEGRVPQVKKGEKKILPDDGTYFEFVLPAGTERILLYASPEKKPELTPKEAWDKQPPIEIKTTQDAVFNKSASKSTEVIQGADVKTLAEKSDAKNPSVRSRGFLVEDDEGKTVIVGSKDSSKRPDLYKEIQLKTE